MRKRRKKKRIRITRNNQELFFGNPIDLPIKESYIIEKSVELFDDEDPCIIHQSYVVKEYADSLLELFLFKESNIVLGEDFLEKLSFLDFNDINELTFELVG